MCDPYRNDVCVMSFGRPRRGGYGRGIYGDYRLDQGLHPRGRRRTALLKGRPYGFSRPVARLAPTGGVGLCAPTDVSSVVAPAPPLELSVLQVPGNLTVSGMQGEAGTTAACRVRLSLSKATDGNVRAPAVSSAAAHRKSSPRRTSDLSTTRVPTGMGAVAGTTMVRGAARGKDEEWDTVRVVRTDGTPTMPKTGKRGPRPGPIPVGANEGKTFFVGLRIAGWGIRIRRPPIFSMERASVSALLFLIPSWTGWSNSFSPVVLHGIYFAVLR